MLSPFWSSVIVLTLVPSLAQAVCTLQASANSYRVPNGSCYEIIGPSCICRDVTNSAANGLDILVPAKTYAEWFAFYTNPPTGVTAVNACGIDTFVNSRTVTIDKTKVGSADSANFPMLFSGTYSYLATLANGGKVESASGHDIIFTSDVAGTTKLDHEIESYDPVTGAVNFWVRVPTLSASTDTVIYLWYGKNCIASQENRTGVWDANFMSVWHFASSTTLSAADSTSNARNGSILGQTGSDMAASGKMGGGARFDGSNDYLYSPSYGTPPTSITLTAWIKPNAAGGVVFSEQGSSALNGGWHDSQIEVQTNNSVKSCMWIGSLRCVVAGTAIVYGNWYYVVMKYAATGTTLSGIMNGVVGATNVSTKQYPNTGVLFYTVGALDSTNGGNGVYFSGNMDEVRVSSIARSNDWILAEFNNQNSPSTFYTIGAEVIH